MGVLTPSPAVARIAAQYLKHEFRKIFADVRDAAIWRRLDRSLERLPAREPDYSFWALVAAISEGWKVKNVFRRLSDTSYRFRREKVAVSCIVLTGMSPTIDRWTIVKYKRSAVAFAEAWPRDALLRTAIRKAGIRPHRERDHFPVFLFEAEDGLRVFDGMRRTLLALMRGDQTIAAWVGRRVNPHGKPLVSANRCWFLANLYEYAQRKDAAFKHALVRVGREIAAQHRNGRTMLEERIAGWSHDPAIRELVDRMLR